MKTTIFAIALATLSLVSCRKDDETPVTPKVYAEENPLATYLVSSSFNQKTTNYINSGTYEFGLKFTPTVKGKINAVTVKIPDNATNVRVTFWKTSDKSILRTETIPSVTANTELQYSLSSSLELTKDTQYMITFNSNDWYKREKTDATAITYPVTAGNLKIDGYSWIGGTTQTYPTNNETKYYAGDLSFVFQQID